MATEDNALTPQEQAKLKAFAQGLPDNPSEIDVDAIAQQTGTSRRQVLQVIAAVGVGSIAGGVSVSQLVSEAQAQASTSDSDGNVGTPADRVDLFADGIDANGADFNSNDITGVGTLGSASNPADAELEDVNPGSVRAVNFNNNDITNVSSLSTEEATIGGHDAWSQVADQSLPISTSNDKDYKIEYNCSHTGRIYLRLNGDSSGNGYYHSVATLGSTESDADEFLLAETSDTARLEGVVIIRTNIVSPDNRTGFYHRPMLGGPFARYNTVCVTGGRDNTDGLDSISDLNGLDDWTVYERDRTDR